FESYSCQSLEKSLLQHQKMQFFQQFSSGVQSPFLPTAS
ncbi:hypothetical protein A2U01_0115311, partial [Trifolium medium]|nr:hypothetical protein [Trifolium medium]